MAIKLNIPSPLQQVKTSFSTEFEIDLWLKRDDLIHPEVSGNKWRKLKLNIERFKHGKYEKILTFGGAFSNHITATAAICKALNIPCIGIIRGDELTPESNFTLKRAADQGMELVFVSRQDYKARYEKYYHNLLRNQYGNVLIVEEGGANFYGVMGVNELTTEVEKEPDFWVTAIGTGTTSAGLLLGSNKAKVIGVPVFKDGGFIREEIREYLLYAGLTDEEIQEKMDQLILATDYGFGGYGRYTKELIDFINDTYTEITVPFDQVYTGKMFYALKALIQKGSIPQKSSVYALHTGGLQGLLSIKDQLSFDPFKS
jgi:1-aminocyclopropane-1-carboxylate deaminase